MVGTAVMQRQGRLACVLCRLHHDPALKAPQRPGKEDERLLPAGSVALPLVRRGAATGPGVGVSNSAGECAACEAQPIQTCTPCFLLQLQLRGQCGIPWDKQKAALQGRQQTGQRLILPHQEEHGSWNVRVPNATGAGVTAA
jgi:hypothetical protein